MEVISLSSARSADNAEEEIKDDEEMYGYLKDLPNVYCKLKEIGMTKLKTFSYIDSADLDKLCKDELCLTFLETVEFKSVIREIQSIHASNQPNSAKQIVHISEKETVQKKAIDGIKETLEQLTHIQTFFESQNQRIDEYVKSIKAAVDDEFETVQNRLVQRKETLYQQVEYSDLLLC